jgi:NDP-sugar pyrophosphorylase family protein
MMAIENSTAVILAGGLGTRLRSVISDRPKVLAEINGRPFLSNLLDQVAGAGVKQTVLCVGYRGAQIKAAFGDTYREMRLVYSYETMPLGTAGALRMALPLIESETFVAMNGDSFCEVNLRDLWTWHHARCADATLVLTITPDTARYGRVSLASDGMITSFEEKENTAGASWINAGIYVLSCAVAHTIPSGHEVSLEREVFPDWVGRGLYGYRSQGRFLDIGTPDSYAQANVFFGSKAE